MIIYHHKTLKDISSEDVKGIAYVGHSEIDKLLDPIWIKHGTNTAFSARKYITNTVDRLETMVGQQSRIKKMFVHNIFL